MADEPQKFISNGGARRIGDRGLSMGLARYEDCEKNVLWRIRVTKFVNGDVLWEEDATPELLGSLRQWANEALATVLSDGNRKEAR